MKSVDIIDSNISNFEKDLVSVYKFIKEYYDNNIKNQERLATLDFSLDSTLNRSLALESLDENHFNILNSDEEVIKKIKGGALKPIIKLTQDISSQLKKTPFDKIKNENFKLRLVRLQKYVSLIKEISNYKKLTKDIYNELKFLQGKEKIGCIIEKDLKSDLDNFSESSFVNVKINVDFNDSCSSSHGSSESDSSYDENYNSQSSIEYDSSEIDLKSGYLFNNKMLDISLYNNFIKSWVEGDDINKIYVNICSFKKSKEIKLAKSFDLVITDQPKSICLDNSEKNKVFSPTRPSSSLGFCNEIDRESEQSINNKRNFNFFNCIGLFDFFGSCRNKNSEKLFSRSRSRSVSIELKGS